MANELLDKKDNLITRTRTLAERMLDLVAEAKGLRQEGLDAGFASGGDAIVDADFVGANKHMSTAKLLNVFAVFDAIDTSLAANTRQNYVRLQAVRR